VPVPAWQRNQMSVRALADKYWVHRRTVRDAKVEGWVVLADPEGGEFCVQPARLPDPADRPNRA
jgi:hypothetical protein